MGFHFNKTSTLQFILALACLYCYLVLIDDVSKPTKIYFKITFGLTALAALIATLRYGGVHTFPGDISSASAHEKAGNLAKSVGIIGLGLGCVSLVKSPISPIPLDSPIAIGAFALGVLVFVATINNHNDSTYLKTLQIGTSAVIFLAAVSVYTSTTAHYLFIALAVSAAALGAKEKHDIAGLSGSEAFLILYAAANIVFGLAAQVSGR